MMNFLTAAARRALTFRLKLQQSCVLRAALRSPLQFRRNLRLDPGSPVHFCDVIQPFQERDFATLDPAWKALAGLPRDSGSRLPGQTALEPRFRAYIERPRGHSKTTDMAVQIAWIVLASRQPVTGLAAAADHEQASLIHRAVRRLADANPSLCGRLDFIQHVVRNRLSGSRLQIISSDVRSSWGALADFIICDELCHWRSRELWDSLFSTAAKRPRCLLAVLTNAGVGRDWHWEIREHARTDPRWHFSTLDGPQAPWITPDWLDEQRTLLPPAVFERLWLNVWQHSDGEFVSLADAEACRDPALVCQHEGRRGIAYVAAIDYAEKRDLTVGCVCHHDGRRIVVDRMDVVRPTPDSPTLVSWVDDWIVATAARFRDVQFVLDPWQLVATLQRFEAVHRLVRFNFAGGEGNDQLARALRQAIINRTIAWYPGCGQIAHADGRRDDLETELASLLVRQSVSGRIRIDHRTDGVHHDDRAFTLGAACLTLLTQGEAGDSLIVTPPGCDGLFGW